MGRLGVVRMAFCGIFKAEIRYERESVVKVI